MQQLDRVVYQIRDIQDKVLIEFGSLLQARIASVDIKEGTQIIERSFVDGEWEEVVLYERDSIYKSQTLAKTHLTEEEARRLRAQVERDLKSDVKRLRDKVRVTGETLNRRY